MLQFIRHIFRRRGYVLAPPDPLSRELTGNEREALMRWTQDPTTKLALRAMEDRRLSLFTCPQSAEGIGNRARQIQGWETYRNTLLTLPLEPKKRQEVLESYQVPSP